MQSRNDYDVHLKRLLDALAQIEFMACFNRSASDAFAKRLLVRLGQARKRKSSGGDDKSRPIVGSWSRISLLNLDASKPLRFPYGGFQSFDELYVNCAEEHQLRANGMLLCQIHERYEEYFRAMCGEAYWLGRSGSLLIGSKDKKRYIETRHVRQDKVGTRQFYMGYACWASSRNIDSLVRVVHKKIPSVSSLLTSNRFNKNMLECLNGVAWSRHTLVHAGGVCDKIDVAKLAPDAQLIVRKMLRQSVVDSRLTILPSSSDVSEVIEIVATVAWEYYKALSSLHGRTEMSLA